MTARLAILLCAAGVVGLPTVAQAQESLPEPPLVAPTDGGEAPAPDDRPAPEDPVVVAEPIADAELPAEEERTGTVSVSASPAAVQPPAAPPDHVETAQVTTPVEVAPVEPARAAKPPRIPLSADERCSRYADRLRRGYCRNGVSLVNSSCAQTPDPDACHDEARAHPCVRRPRSDACLQALRDGSACTKLGSESPECRLLLAMRNFYCATDPGQCGGAGGGVDETLIANRTETSFGIPDPGRLGDLGIRTNPPSATRPPARSQIPFTGLPLAPLGLLGGALLAVGLALARPRPSC